ncbi:hypothetical protein EHQ12_12365 [Leptospira gomenensis]|uniref:Uncharacterized protein n=1 Tax=Leptospira gomenensis TaxID=2484974 RepID=A0A5F1YPH3_9LEPT|nr:hypothetical protein [Leptospira gomenensis]TGK32727.1 hypothetical protein EHQ17_12210 [Leptospira gomenensis]TGK36874.1 hypothetical protein EHQ12_12365 [Leptospira gomenensis]TGK44346.1 hypothetical protein EHQ07_11680 [Leptospira gomenensis]TGK58839.1 hypothetical protein EHQ13_13500 [Leptospira gomenensis]
MTGFFTVMLCLGVAAVFFHLLSSVDNKRLDKAAKKREAENPNSREYGDPKKVYGKNWDPDLPKPRICPICGKYLQKTEYLYAVISEPPALGIKRHAKIFGCRYCYLGLETESPGESKNADLRSVNYEQTPTQIKDEELGL